MTRRSWNTAAMFLLAIAVSDRLAAQEPTPPRAGEPQLKLSTEEWNFGEVWQGQPLKGEVTLTNVGDAPLEILDITTSCGCTPPSQPKSPLAPGESDDDHRLRLGETPRPRQPDDHDQDQ